MNMLLRHPLALIVLAQLCGTSLWFSPNSAADSLSAEWALTTAQFGQLTGATQIGFILGSLTVAASGVADRFPASKLFASACFLGAVFNACFALLASDFHQGLVLRFAVGICLAGIYPLGMKMVIGWTQTAAGSTLGLLVGMLTLGTALPHAVRAGGGSLSWHGVVLASSLLAIAGGALVQALGDGPYLPRAKAAQAGWGKALKAFKGTDFRASALAYFGHMWELYAFWTLVPFFINDLISTSDFASDSGSALAPALSFSIIGIGALGSVIAGRLSQRVGSPIVAAASLGTSGLMCLAYPFARPFGMLLCIPMLLLWGLTVISDSAQFSAISARACPPELVGGALAIQNSIGFLITVFSITLVTQSFPTLGVGVAWYLLPGPLLGLACFMPVLLKFRAPG
ncbi:MFS family permease [Achromobacter deleyi]|uniref:MFS transporter n=1 Tax=Achromobacter deleyi TaxID=1353891 RepID=UPI002855B4EC|nr:MFS transporter [Achromobacter deleyi]MDR6600963.1 MFS family permease [Achromobacter deleyi]